MKHINIRKKGIPSFKMVIAKNSAQPAQNTVQYLPDVDLSMC